MNARRIMPVMLMALVVSGLLTFWMSKRFSKPVAAAHEPVKRFVAVNKNVEAGEQLQPAMLQMVEWPASHPLKGAFTKPEELTGRTVLYPIVAGDVVLDHSLAAPGASTGLSSRIPAGMRAISLRSDEVAGVAGFLLPGTYVDVLITYRPATEPDLITSTVLQNVRVLAAGQKMEADPDGKANTASVVTLLVSPQDAEKVTLASSLGKILFVLRNGGDRKEVADLPPQLSISGGPIAHPAQPHDVPVHDVPVHVSKPAAKPVPRYTVETMAGSKMTEATFEGKTR